jgi:hypothetical protein
LWRWWRWAARWCAAAPPTRWTLQGRWQPRTSRTRGPTTTIPTHAWCWRALQQVRARVRGRRQPVWVCARWLALCCRGAAAERRRSATLTMQLPRCVCAVVCLRVRIPVRCRQQPLPAGTPR